MPHSLQETSMETVSVTMIEPSSTVFRDVQALRQKLKQDRVSC